MFERVADFLRRRPPARAFQAFQIEVTTRCVLRCVMCPRVALAHQWPEMDMPWETFQRIACAFPLTQHVHLQGWGEPLLHPRLFDMIALAKGAGCRVGLTTNGMRLDQDTGGRLLDLNLDLIAVSIAGNTAGTHESIRVGSDFARILENVRRLLTLRREQGRDRPKVEFSFLMTRTNMQELPEAVDLAASLGVDELYATNLDYIITPEHDALKAFGCPPPLCAAFARNVEEARGRARRAGLVFRPYPLNPEEVAVCEANPLKILFLACDGWVSPCTYMGLAGQSEIPRRIDGRSLRVPRLRFGSILDQELMDIWNSPPYRSFRGQLEARVAEARALAMGIAMDGGEAAHPCPPPPPEVCRTCYKLYGL
jgi:MoaA/NifB/PqqE/SkfB family radical SAM enzyme